LDRGEGVLPGTLRGKSQVQFEHSPAKTNIENPRFPSTLNRFIKFDEQFKLKTFSANFSFFLTRKSELIVRGKNIMICQEEKKYV
jgi:hypothetical protein